GGVQAHRLELHHVERLLQPVGPGQKIGAHVGAQKPRHPGVVAVLHSLEEVALVRGQRFAGLLHSGAGGGEGQDGQKRRFHGMGDGSRGSPLSPRGTRWSRASPGRGRMVGFWTNRQAYPPFLEVAAWRNRRSRSSTRSSPPTRARSCSWIWP